MIGAFLFIPNLYIQNILLPSKNEASLKFEKEYIRNKDVYRKKGLHKQIEENKFLFIKNYDVKKTKDIILICKNMKTII